MHKKMNFSLSVIIVFCLLLTSCGNNGNLVKNNLEKTNEEKENIKYQVKEINLPITDEAKAVIIPIQNSNPLQLVAKKTVNGKIKQFIYTLKDDETWSESNMDNHQYIMLSYDERQYFLYGVKWNDNAETEIYRIDGEKAEALELENPSDVMMYSEEEIESFDDGQERISNEIQYSKRALEGLSEKEKEELKKGTVKNKNQKASISYLYFLENGEIVSVYSKSSELFSRVHNVETGKLIREFSMPTGISTNALFLNNHTYFIGSGTKNTIQVMNGDRFIKNIVFKENHGVTSEHDLSGKWGEGICSDGTKELYLYNYSGIFKGMTDGTELEQIVDPETIAKVDLFDMEEMIPMVMKAFVKDDEDNFYVLKFDINNSKSHLFKYYKK